MILEFKEDDISLLDGPPLSGKTSLLFDYAVQVCDDYTVQVGVMTGRGVLPLQPHPWLDGITRGINIT